MIFGEVEDHLIQTNIPFANPTVTPAVVANIPSNNNENNEKDSAPSSPDSLNNFYDAGFYQRGDYVEIFKGTEVGWKRGRIASDKKNGSYDIRMETGVDEVHRGRYMRFHFRSKEKVEIRLLHTTEWQVGQILRQEKNGHYAVVYEQQTNQEEGNVDPKRLLPQGRGAIREKTVEHAKKLEEIIQAASFSQLLKYSLPTSPSTAKEKKNIVSLVKPHKIHDERGPEEKEEDSHHLRNPATTDHNRTVSPRKNSNKPVPPVEEAVTTHEQESINDSEHHHRRHSHHRVRSRTTSKEEQQLENDRHDKDHKHHHRSHHHHNRDRRHSRDKDREQTPEIVRMKSPEITNDNSHTNNQVEEEAEQHQHSMQEHNHDPQTHRHQQRSSDPEVTSSNEQHPPKEKKVNRRQLRQKEIQNQSTPHQENNKKVFDGGNLERESHGAISSDSDFYYERKDNKTVEYPPKGLTIQNNNLHEKKNENHSSQNKYLISPPSEKEEEEEQNRRPLNHEGLNQQTGAIRVLENGVFSPEREIAAVVPSFPSQQGQQQHQAPISVSPYNQLSVQQAPRQQQEQQQLQLTGSLENYFPSSFPVQTNNSHQNNYINSQRNNNSNNSNNNPFFPPANNFFPSAHPHPLSSAHPSHPFYSASLLQNSQFPSYNYNHHSAAPPVNSSYYYNNQLQHYSQEQQHALAVARNVFPSSPPPTTIPSFTHPHPLYHQNRPHSPRKGLESLLFNNCEYRLGDRVLVQDENSGRRGPVAQHECLIHSINLDGTINLLTGTGAILVNMSPIQLTPLPFTHSNIINNTTNSNNNNRQVDSHHQRFVSTPATQNLMENPAPSNGEMERMVFRTSSPFVTTSRVDPVLLSQSAPPKTHHFPITNNRHLQNFLKGERVAVQFEGNSYESVAVAEGTIIADHGEGFYSVLLDLESDERIIEERFITRSVKGTTVYNNDNHNLFQSPTMSNHRDRDEQYSSSIAFSEMTNKMHDLNLQSAYKPYPPPSAAEKGSQMSTSAQKQNEKESKPPINRTELNRKRNEEQHQNKHETRETPRRHSSSRVTEQNSKHEEQEPEVPLPSYDHHTRRRSSSSHRRSSHHTLDYSKGMKVLYQPPGSKEMKSYLGTITAVNDYDQSVDLILDSGIFQEKISFQNILPFNFSPPDRSSHSRGGRDHHQHRKEEENNLLSSQEPVSSASSFTPQRPTNEQKSNGRFERRGSRQEERQTPHKRSPERTQRRETEEEVEDEKFNERQRGKQTEKDVHHQLNDEKPPATREGRRPSTRTGTEFSSVQFGAIYHPTISNRIGKDGKKQEEEWNSLLFFCDYQRNYQKQFKEKHFQIQLTAFTTPSEGEEGVEEQEIDFHSFEDPSSSPFVYFPSVEEKDHLMLIWKFRSSGVKKETKKGNNKQKGHLLMTVYDNGELLHFAKLPFITGFSAGSHSSYEVVPFQEISTEKRNIVNLLPHSTSDFSGNHLPEKNSHSPAPSSGIAAATQLFFSFEELTTFNSFQEIVQEFPVVPSLLQNKKKMNKQRLHEELLSRYFFVNVFFSDVNLLVKSTGLEKVRALFPRNVGFVVSFHFAPPLSSKRNPLVESYAMIYQSIAKNNKFVLLFTLLPISMKPNVLSADVLVSSLKNIIENTFPLPSENWENEIQFWEFREINLKGSNTHNDSEGHPLLGMKWKYFFQLIPYMKLVLSFLILRDFLLLNDQRLREQQEENSRERNRSRNGNRRTKPREEKEELISFFHEVYSHWFLSLANPSAASSFELKNLLVYFEFLCILESHFPSLTEAGASRGTTSPRDHNDMKNTNPSHRRSSSTSNVSKQLLNRLESSYQEIVSSSSDDLFHYCDNLLQQFLVSSHSYFIGNGFQENISFVMSILWERTKFFSSERVEEKNLFEYLNFYCLALPQNVLSHSSSHSHHNRLLLSYCSSDYFHSRVSPLFASFSVTRTTHNQSEHFISVKEFPFKQSIEKSLEKQPSDHAHSNHRRKSESHHHHSSNSRSPREVVNDNEEQENHKKDRRTEATKENKEKNQQIVQKESHQKNSPQRHDDRTKKTEKEQPKEESLTPEDEFIRSLCSICGLPSSQQVATATSQSFLQLEGFVKEMMNQGIYSLSDFDQLPALLLKQSLHERLSPEKEREYLIQILSQFFQQQRQQQQQQSDSHRLSWFLQMKIVSYLVDHHNSPHN
jgi:hypothetical protein